MPPSTHDGAEPSSTPSTPKAPAPNASPDQVPSVVEAPRMATTTFPNWDAFSAYLDEYQRQTFQLYICKSSTSVATRNRRLAASKDTHSESTANTSNSRHAIPTEIGFYAKTMICTHGGKPRSRSRGLRPRQQFRPMQCPARMNVLAQKRLQRDCSQVSEWQVVVTQHTPIHNHPLDAETFKTYPRNRRVQDPVVLEAVNALRKAGVKQREIRKYITEKEPAKRVTRSDVNNLLTKLKTDDSFATAPQQAASTRIEDQSGSTSAATASNEQEQLATDVTRSQELGTEGVRLPSQPIAAGFTLRKSSGVNREVVGAEQWTRHGGNQANSLHSLRNTSEVSSGSFKLRVRRLEEQNLALYTQNTKLHEQNQLYIAELNKAHKKAREAEAKVLTLQKSQTSLAEGVSALSEEVARLRKEDERWKKSLAQQQSPPVVQSDSESQGSDVTGSHDVDGRSGRRKISTRQAPKRAMNSSDAAGTFTSEPARPPKRAARDSSAVR
ncbi:hypothetical protein PRNP1_011776 [Phytophthora ramorum]